MVRSALGVHCSAQAGAPLSSVLVAVCDSAQGLAVHVMRGAPLCSHVCTDGCWLKHNDAGHICFIVELGLAFHGMGLGLLVPFTCEL